MKDDENVNHMEYEINNKTKEEEVILQNYQEKMRKFRNGILYIGTFAKILTERQKYIRAQLGLDQEGNKQQGVKKGFKIIDSLNLQFYFVYDPDYEYYSAWTGQKVSNQEASEKDLCYFLNGDSRSCIH